MANETIEGSQLGHNNSHFRQSNQTKLTRYFNFARQSSFQMLRQPWIADASNDAYFPAIHRVAHMPHAPDKRRIHLACSDMRGDPNLLVGILPVAPVKQTLA